MKIKLLNLKSKTILTGIITTSLLLFILYAYWQLIQFSWFYTAAGNETFIKVYLFLSQLKPIIIIFLLIYIYNFIKKILDICDKINNKENVDN